MSEQSITTHIGDDIAVVVWFDYSPSEKQTHEEPGCDSEVEITGVYKTERLRKGWFVVEVANEANILDGLSSSTLADLTQQCFEEVESE